MFSDAVDVSVHLAVQQDAISQDRRSACLHSLVPSVLVHTDYFDINSRVINILIIIIINLKNIKR